MEYISQSYDHLLGISGLSEALLNNHFTLYQGYVTNTNALIKEMQSLQLEGKAGLPVFSELRRRFGWEWNGMRLHELYFDNMSKNPKTLSSESLLGKNIVESFGSFENWEQDFRGAGAMRGIGWVVLSYDKHAKKMFNVWIGEHDLGHLAGTRPIVVMDVFEHAYSLDYGIKKADYIYVFMNAINWTEAEKRFETEV